MPPDADVNKMHMLIVVGRHVIINNPSRRDFGSKDGRNRSIVVVNASPANGKAPNVIVCISPFSLTFDAAFVSSSSLRLMPLRRKITVTPYFPMNSSGLTMLPFFPNSGKSFAA